MFNGNIDKQQKQTDERIDTSRPSASCRSRHLSSYNEPTHASIYVQGIPDLRVPLHRRTVLRGYGLARRKIVERHVVGERAIRCQGQVENGLSSHPQSPAFIWSSPFLEAATRSQIARKQDTCSLEHTRAPICGGHLASCFMAVRISKRPDLSKMHRIQQSGIRGSDGRWK